MMENYRELVQNDIQSMLLSCLKPINSFLIHIGESVNAISLSFATSRYSVSFLSISFFHRGTTLFPIPPSCFVSSLVLSTN